MGIQRQAQILERSSTARRDDEKQTAVQWLHIYIVDGDERVHPNIASDVL